MSEFSIKQRVAFLIWLVFFSLFMVGLVYVGKESICEYLSFPSVLIYSTGAAALILAPLIIVPVLLLALSPVLKGKKASDAFARKMSKTIMCGFVMIIFASFLFRFFYLNNLENKGYVQCKSIPTGWMPGMATKYVAEESQCYKQD